MDQGPEKTKTEARAGTTPHVARYVLIWGTLLVIAAFVLILAFYW